jgi:ribosomal-protein-alanine N-acetyltransferase
VADEMEILDVAVLPSSRRRGVARFLVSLALRRAARAGAGTAFLEVRAGNSGARALYAGLGFREAGVRRSYYREPVEDAVLMRLEGLGGQC